MISQSKLFWKHSIKYCVLKKYTTSFNDKFFLKLKKNCKKACQFYSNQVNKCNLSSYYSDMFLKNWSLKKRQEKKKKLNKLYKFATLNKKIVFQLIQIFEKNCNLNNIFFFWYFHIASENYSFLKSDHIHHFLKYVSTNEMCPCPICYENENNEIHESDESDEIKKRKKRVIHECGHSLCHVCHEKMLQNNLHNCPLCRKEFKSHFLFLPFFQKKNKKN